MILCVTTETLSVLVDTNVWSELARIRPEPRIAAFLARNSARVALSTIVLAEIEYGIAKATDPNHRNRLISFRNDIFGKCAERVLKPDFESAVVWGRLKAELERRGEPIANMDLMIAAQAIAAPMPLVTRNVSDMARTGAVIINPWDA